MKALISPNEMVLNGYRIAEVTETEFVIAEPLYWVDCSDDCIADAWYFNAESHECEVVPPYAPTADENKQIAISSLQKTDWAASDDVGNPEQSNPYLANQAEFIAYRNAIRQHAVYPVAGYVEWEVAPIASWVQV